MAVPYRIEYYSITYFNRITAIKVLYVLQYVKGGAQMCCINAAAINVTIMHRVSASPLMAVQRYSALNAVDTIEIRNGFF